MTGRASPRGRREVCRLALSGPAWFARGVVTLRTSLATALLSLAWGGCGSVAPSLGPVAAFTANPAGGDSAPLTPIAALSVPHIAEIFLRPLWFVGALHPPGEPPSRTRLQIAVRLLHRDGGTSQWLVTRDSHHDGATGLPGPTRSGRYRYDFPEQTIGPVRADALVGLEVLVSRVAPAAEGRIVALRAGAILDAAPPLRASDGSLLAEAQAAAGAPRDALELAARLPIQLLPDGAPGRSLSWVVFVEAEAPDSEPGRLARVASLVPVDQEEQHPVADAVGDRVAHTSAFALAVGIQVERSRGEDRDRKGPKSPAPPPRRDERLKRPTALTQGELRR